MFMEKISKEDLEVFERIAPFPVAIINCQSVLYLSKSCKKMMGYDEDEDVNVPLDRIFQEKSVIYDIREILDNNFGFMKHELIIYKKDRSLMWVEYVGKLVEYQSQTCILVQAYDITEKKQIEKSLRQLSNVRSLMLKVSQSILNIDNIQDIFQLILRSALNSIKNSQLGCIFLKQDGEFVVVAQQGFAKDIETFRIPVEDTFLYKVTEGRMDEIKYLTSLEEMETFRPVRTAYGEERMIASSLTGPIYVDGELFGMIDIDSLKCDAFDSEDIQIMTIIRNNIEIAIANHLFYEEKARAAKYDRLTNVYNRTYFEEYFEKFRDRFLGGAGTVSLVLFDLNDLKKINDTFGHLAGDMAIRIFAEQIKEVLGPEDVFARIGGDEFAGLFFDIDKEKLREKMKRSLASLEKKKFLWEQKEIMACGEAGVPKELIISFSFGIATFGSDGTQLEILLCAADEKMYKFKRKYKQRLMDNKS